MSNDPPENKPCNPEDVWAQLEPEERAQIVKQLSRLAYRFVIAQFTNSKEKEDEIAICEKQGS
jgi:hypothetical protein